MMNGIKLHLLHSGHVLVLTDLLLLLRHRTAARGTGITGGGPLGPAGMEEVPVVLEGGEVMGRIEVGGEGGIGVECVV